MADSADQPNEAADQLAPIEPVEAKQPATDRGGQPAMTVKVYAPFQIYYEGEASRLSAVNAVGPFDILPEHRNFLCMLVPCEVEIDTADKGLKKVKINRALLHVHSNHVTVFVDV